jgi:hypothetical protein
LFVIQAIVAPDAVIALAVVPEIVRGATSEMLAVAEEPFKVAVTVAVWSETSAPVLIVNVAEAALAATLTEDGTVNRVEALSESVTAVLLPVVLLTLEFDSVTVQVVVALDTRLAAAHCREEMVGSVAVDRESVAGWDEPFSVAVTVAL